MRYGWRFARKLYGIGFTFPKGYKYLGPCRCGFGPCAYYVDNKGRVVTPYEMFLSTEPTKEDLEEELEMLKKEKEMIEKEIEELEKKIK